MHPPPPDIGDLDAVFHEYDTVLSQKATMEMNILGLLDASSLLWRMSVMGVDPGEERWEKITEKFKDWIGKHGLAW